MPAYTVTRIQSTPDWAQIPSVAMVDTGWCSPCPVAAKAQLCHDGKNLYVRLEAEESDIRATLSGPLDPVCTDSCLEFFFAPMPEDSRYFNFEYNPLGTIYLGFGAERATRVRQIVSQPDLFHARPFHTEKGWGITYVIPASFISLYMPNFSFTGIAAGNFYKCGDKTSVPHYLAWSPLHCDTPDYHCREDFGTLIFE